LVKLNYLGPNTTKTLCQFLSCFGYRVILSNAIIINMDYIHTYMD
jgi:hypothetical protein